MIRVCITGAGSYIGTHIAAALAQSPEMFVVRQVDVAREWDADALAACDVVVHVAGIAHQKETDENRALYTSVNRDLALRVAQEAKKRGVKQFVFFSSMSVYGMTTGHIDERTLPAPNTAYGISKWEAEQGLKKLESEAFRVAVLRPPMIYGRGCRGNYPRLAALARSVSFFPYVDNQRSMLYIGVLCAFMRRLLESGQGGLYFPQNKAYVSTVALVKEVARCHRRRLFAVRGFGWLLKKLAPKVSLVGKVFGSLTYDLAMSQAFQDDGQPDFAATIAETEGAL